MTRITIDLRDEEREALKLLSKMERRNLREQAAVLIRLQLQAFKLLESETLEDFIPGSSLEN